MAALASCLHFLPRVTQQVQIPHPVTSLEMEVTWVGHGVRLDSELGPCGCGEVSGSRRQGQVESQGRWCTSPWGVLPQEYRESLRVRKGN